MPVKKGRPTNASKITALQAQLAEGIAQTKKLVQLIEAQGETITDLRKARDQKVDIIPPTAGTFTRQHVEQIAESYRSQITAGSKVGSLIAERSKPGSISKPCISQSVPELA